VRSGNQGKPPQKKTATPAAVDKPEKKKKKRGQPQGQPKR
jgi:hypothetical protein